MGYSSNSIFWIQKILTQILKIVMKNSNSIINVTNIIREFLQNEAKTLEISRGKMLRDADPEKDFQKYLKVG